MSGARMGPAKRPSVCFPLALDMYSLPFAPPCHRHRALARCHRRRLGYLSTAKLTGDSIDRERAALARTRRCAQTRSLRHTVSARGRRPVRECIHVPWPPSRCRADPLPGAETADEVCEVARRLGVPAGDVLLGAHATETRRNGLLQQGILPTVGLCTSPRTAHSAVRSRAQPSPARSDPVEGTGDL